jgi:hypothetical protein
VSLAGRVPVKIAPDSLPIKTGDNLTSSNTYPGMAMKATNAGETIGKALESWRACRPEPSEGPSEASGNDNCGKSKIVMFVNVGWAVPRESWNLALTADGELAAASPVVSSERSESRDLASGDTDVATLDPSTSVGMTEENDGLLSLTQRVTQLEDLVAIMAGTNTLTTSSGFMIQDSGFMITGSYMDNEVNLGGGLVSPLASTKLTLDVSTDTIQVLGSATIGGNLTVGLLTINDMDASINSLGETLKIQSLGLSNIELMSGKIVIDTEGNIKVEGNIEAKTVAAEEFKVTGTKSADSAILRAGELTLTVSTEAVLPESRVFTQITSTPENAGTALENTGISLVVTKLPGTGFEVRLPIPAITDIPFDWFVIGN